MVEEVLQCHISILIDFVLTKDLLACVCECANVNVTKCTTHQAHTAA